jgi:hypothetical protein
MWLCPDITPLLDDVVLDIVELNPGVKPSETGNGVPVTKKEIKNAENDIFDPNSSVDLGSHNPVRSSHI